MVHAALEQSAVEKNSWIRDQFIKAYRLMLLARLLDDKFTSLFPMVSHLGAMISVVNGALFARRLKGLNGAVGATAIGDGGTSTGAFHEGLNQAAIERLPLVLVVANNQYAYSTPTSRQFACES